MSASLYTQLVVDHFDQPRNTGRFAPAADIIAGGAGQRSEGTQFALSARVDGGAIIAVRAQTFGCPHCIAAASWLSEQLIGTRWDQLARWRWQEIAGVLDIPTGKRGRLLILEDAVHALAENWRRKAENGVVVSAQTPQSP